MKLLTTKSLIKKTKTSSKRLATWRKEGMPYYDISSDSSYSPEYRYEEREVMEWIRKKFHVAGK